MAIRDIVPDSDPLLRKISRNVESYDFKLHKLLGDMLDTMREEDGIGLAAVQVGILRNVVVMEIDDFYLELINPIITSRIGEQIKIEGCLSVKGNTCYVKRPMEIDVEYYDRKGNFHTKHLVGLEARCCCHEVDHLQGIIFYDNKYNGVVPEDTEE